LLAEEAKKVTLPTGAGTFAYVAAEYRTVKELRWYFREELGWTAKMFYAFSYWKAGMAEDQSVADRQAEKKSE
jgi:Siderophore-interacting protein